MVYICDAVLEKMDLESGFQKIFASVTDAELSGDSAYIYIGGVEKLENLSKRLSGGIDAFISGVLFLCLVKSLVECEFLRNIWKEVVMYLTAMSSCNAMRRPYSPLLLEGRVVCRMMVTDEQDRKGVKDLMFLSSLSFCLGIDESESLSYSFF